MFWIGFVMHFDILAIKVGTVVGHGIVKNLRPGPDFFSSLKAQLYNLTEVMRNYYAWYFFNLCELHQIPKLNTTSFSSCHEEKAR
ncbi:MAG: hypothetical protein ABJF26_08440 [Lentilitoribacter sp.]